MQLFKLDQENYAISASIAGESFENTNRKKRKDRKENENLFPLSSLSPLRFCAFEALCQLDFDLLRRGIELGHAEATHLASGQL